MHWIAPPETVADNAALEKRRRDTADQFRADSGLKSLEYSVSVFGLISLRLIAKRVRAVRSNTCRVKPIIFCA